MRVARDEADFCLSRVAAYLAAAPVAARYVAVLVGRSPICAFVPTASPIQRPDQLSGRRVGGAVWAMAEFVGALSWLGLPPASVVPMSRTSGGGLLQEACAMLADDRVDMVVDFEDLLPRARRHAGMDLRSVPLGAEVYSSGLVAGDGVPDELVGQMSAAVLATLERQRRDPARGLPQLLARSPHVVPADAIEGWHLVEPRIFRRDRPGSMTAEGWAATLAYAGSSVDPALVWRRSPAPPAAEASAVPAVTSAGPAPLSRSAPAP